MLNLTNITLFLSNHFLFKNINLKVESGDRIGLIGPNGSGKTTLLRIISGQMQADEGQVEKSADTTVGFLEQEVLETRVDQTVRELAVSAFEEANRLEQRLESIGTEIAEMEDYENPKYQKLLDEMEKVQSRLDIIGGGGRVSEAEATLEGLGFKTEDLDRPLEVFSGGWRMRALLARLLLQKPDVLLLDEPTNHLDIDSIEWLEQYLQHYQGAVILVSHDRFFLNRMCNRIAEIRNQTTYDRPGNYDDYQEYRQLAVEQQKREWESQQQEIAQAERFIERFRYKASKARQVQSRIKALEKMEKVEYPEERTADMRIEFPPPPRAGDVVTRIDELWKTYPASGEHDEVPVFTTGQPLEIERGRKIALIGPNGAGKSTLARILYGEEPFEGNLKEGHNLIRTFFAQHLADLLNSDKTVLETMEAAAQDSETRAKVRTLLGCFLFTGEDVFKPVSVLSGGERSRLALAKSLLQPANFLILDEPTNHLDIRSKDLLLEAIKRYKGTVLAVSHDRHFLSGFADSIWRVENGGVSQFDGGFDYYEWKIRQQKASKNQPAVGASPGKTGSNGKTGSDGGGNSDGEKKTTSQNVRKSKDQKRKEAELRNQINKKTRTLKNEISRMEQQLENLESEKQDLEIKLADETYLEENQNIGKLTKKHSELTAEIDSLMEQWEQKSEELEKAERKAEQQLTSES